MSIKRIILWRHGETDANKDLRIQGAIDIPLNARGQAQAHGAAAQLAQLAPTRIYCSDLSRSQATAAALSEITGIAPIVDKRLQERNYGKWEGLTAPEIAAQWPEEFARWQEGGEPGLGIETREACGLRMVAAINEAVAASSTPDETIVFSSHGGAITCALTTLFGLNPSNWHGIRVMDNCHWAMLIPGRGKNPDWRLVMYNRWNAVTTDVEYGWEK